MQLKHLLRRDVLRRLRYRRNQACILDREESLGDLNGHDDRQRNCGEEHAKRDCLMAQHDIQAPSITRQHCIKTGFDGAVDAAVVARLTSVLAIWLPFLG